MAQRESFFGRPTINPAPTPNKSPAETQPSGLTNGNRTSTPSANGAGVLAAPTLTERIDAAAKSNSLAASSESRGSQLIVGPKIRMKGVEIVDCDTLVVEGHIEATMDSRVIQIAAGGTFTGTAGIDEADIHGGFSGELVARKCLTIHASGKVSGKVRYRKLVVEEGGEISGEVSKLTDGQPVTLSRPSSTLSKTEEHPPHARLDVA
jgi:cytoskeletal protein CcmA (bactofilin family)